jgi:hypothetical protein
VPELAFVTVSSPFTIGAGGELAQVQADVDRVLMLVVDCNAKLFP